eukprot:PLAT479.1.p2 GENE.PLAT479.1~~PLAT479.1.p2  ORF type:complete len:138 (+),score=55.02 PLAT479.1:20-433(+)
MEDADKRPAEAPFIAALRKARLARPEEVCKQAMAALDECIVVHKSYNACLKERNLLAGCLESYKKRVAPLQRVLDEAAEKLPRVAEHEAKKAAVYASWAEARAAHSEAMRRARERLWREARVRERRQAWRKSKESES